MKNKKQRRDYTFFKYKKRIAIWSCKLKIYKCRDGSEIYNPKVIDILEDNGQYKFKHTNTICSCYGCSGYYKYRRHEKKIEYRKLIKEYQEEIE